MPKKIIDYENLANPSKERLASMLDKIYQAGLTTTEVKKLSDEEFKDKLNISQEIGTAGFKGQRSLSRQITLDDKRRLGSSDLVLKRYAKKGYTINNLKDIKKELIKSSGSGFYEISRVIRKQTGKSVADSYKHANQLLKIPRSQYHKLEEFEVELLINYDTP